MYTERILWGRIAALVLMSIYLFSDTLGGRLCYCSFLPPIESCFLNNGKDGQILILSSCGTLFSKAAVVLHQ